MAIFEGPNVKQYNRLYFYILIDSLRETHN